MSQPSDMPSTNSVALNVAGIKPETCPTHGEYLPERFVFRGEPRCPACNTEHKRQQSERGRRQDNMLASGLVGGRYEHATFASFNAATAKQRAVLQACVEYASTVTPGKSGGMILIGPPGTGKTFLGAAIVAAVVAQRGLTAKLIPVNTMIRRIRDTWRRDSECTEGDVLGSLIAPQLLVLDDLGAGNNSESEQRHLLDLIDARYVRRHPTLVTTNLTLRELKAVAGERSYDRLREDAKALILDWNSFRGPSA